MWLFIHLIFIHSLRADFSDYGFIEINYDIQTQTIDKATNKPAESNG
jgi:hypothetical protein